MLVSLAVLALALGVVGVVFTVTTRTASQAAAYSETNNWVRQFMQQIEADLRFCQPSQSVLVLVGRTQAAALTQSDLEAGKFYRVLLGNPGFVPGGYDPEMAPGLDPPGSNGASQYSNPRADILMFISNRPTASQAADANVPNDPYAGGVKFAPIRVVYGHAALGDAVWNAGTQKYDFPPTNALRHIEQDINAGNNSAVQSRIPANRWHLARVATIIEPPPVGPGGLLDMQFSQAACANLGAGRPYGAGMPGDAALLNLPRLLEQLGPSSRYHAWSCSPYDYLGSSWDAQIKLWLNTLVYSTFAPYPTTPYSHHVATVLEDVPVDLQSNLAVHMLPGCAWFQVEFLMPEDPRNSVDYSNPTPGVPNDWSARTDMARWTAVNANPAAGSTTYVFVPDTPENRQRVAAEVDNLGVPLWGSRLATFAKLDPRPSAPDTVSNRIIRMWPYAIRVTVRVFDPRGRLKDPIVRSIVHRFE